MKIQICNKCKQGKSITEFHKGNNKNSLSYYCKSCESKRIKKYRKLHRIELKKYDKKYCAEHRGKRKIYYELHKEEIKEQHKKWYKLHSKEMKKYRNTHKVKARKYMKNRLKIDISFKLCHYLRTRLNKVLKNNIKSKSISKLLDCSIEFLKQHLEKQFTQGMSWNNYGKWHIDHIKPCCTFDLSKPEEQTKCFNYTNLQPLWALDNLKKKRKLKCI